MGRIGCVEIVKINGVRHGEWYTRSHLARFGRVIRLAKGAADAG